MSRRTIFLLALLCFALLFIATTTYAGGWATITVEEWPQDMAAGQPVLVRFTVRQHGQDRGRLNDLTPVIRARNTSSGEAIEVQAKSENRDGVYRAEIIFPSAGDWSWSIQAFSMDQPMPILVVKEGEAPRSATAAISPSTATYIGLAGLVGTAIALTIALVRRARWAVVLAAVCVLIGGAGFASASASEQTQISAESGAAQMNPEEYGEVLFVSKGCVTCHINRRIEEEFVPFSTEMGPDLSDYQAAPEFLRMWLADPLSVRPAKNADFPMPNLELDSEEIEALIAFINLERVK
ncbi:MAG: hypothetical protein A2Z16_04230 [Chloroflexi bacterium RBG_16_54_18]|nr:MAG: hypothetical protein A2Z16_04230 [Chloroflexi bacterium RBG_16_54_18]